MRVHADLRIVPLALLGLGLCGCSAHDKPPGDTDVDSDAAGTESGGDTSGDGPGVDTDVEVQIQPPTGGVTGLSINGGGNSASLLPGADAELVADYEIANDPTCASCRAQVVIGIDGKALGCVYDDVPGVSTTTGQGTLDTVVSGTPGTYVVQQAIFNAASCDAAKAGFDRLTLDDGDTIGSIEVFESSGAGAVETVTAVRSRSTSGGSCTTLDCPAGKTLLSLGISEASTAQHFYYYPLDSDTGKFCFEVENVTIQVTCGTPASTRVVTSDTTFNAQSGASSTHTLDVNCSAGETMMSGYGGREGRNSDGVLPGVRSVLRAGLGMTSEWRMVLAEITPSAYASVSAICSSAHAPDTVTQSVALAVPGDACATATCPSGKVALGGGYTISGTTGDMPSHRQLYVNHREGVDGWKACYHNTSTSSSGNGTLLVEAYCAVDR